jgi:hypothetical protein
MVAGEVARDPTHHSPKIKVLYFGLARSADTGEPLTPSGATVGTLAYMAPRRPAAGR